MKHLAVERLAQETTRADVVIVGSGVAGLSAALDLTAGAVRRSVTLLTKAELGTGGSSAWAQGGVAAAVGVADSPAEHAADTLTAGAGLCDPAAVEDLVAAGPGEIRRLIVAGARFDRGADGRLLLGREAAHRRRRILHAQGDATGAEMVRALVAALRRASGLTVHERTFALDLVLDEGKVVGVLARHPGGRVVFHRASAVILATGGFGQLYEHTTNPPEATGDGLAMAARAGACLADLEFIQFHPTALATGRDPLPLLTEALRGEGAILIDNTGERFLLAEHPQAELAPRDVVARAIWHRQQLGHEVFLDAREAVGEAFPRRFPTAWASCQAVGLDPRREPLPVTPAAHYAMAGIAVDALGRTSLPGLWACGEVTASGVHGANRLASNSLLEALVQGAHVAAAVGRWMPARPRPISRGGWVRREVSGGSETAERERIRRLAWQELGLVRERRGLTRALEELGRLRATHPGEVANLLTIGRMVAAAALVREESRGAHCRRDFPEPLPEWQRRLGWTYRGGEGLPLEPAERVETEAEREIA